tara:strand:+ start:9 stop:2750 length:2742 start_codon:yes stop_codon:yes gene_type:complete
MTQTGQEKSAKQGIEAELARDDAKWDAAQKKLAQLPKGATGGEFKHGKYVPGTATYDKKPPPAKPAPPGNTGTGGPTPDGTVTGEAGRSAVAFDHQCYLMHNWRVFLSHSQNSVNKGGFAYSTCLMHENASEFTSKLTSILGVKNLFRGRTVDYANLVPKILLYKSTPPSNGTSGSKTMLRFSDHTTRESIDSMTQSRGGRGDDVVLKSFDLVIGDPAAKGGGEGSMQQASIRAKLTFLCESAKSLWKTRPGGYAYADLFSSKISYGTPPLQSKDKNAEQFRILAVVGWQIPPGKVDARNRSFANALKSANMVMEFSMNKYDLDFKENGNVQVTLECITKIEEQLNSPEFDIFSDHYGEMAALQSQQDAEMDAQDKSISDGPQGKAPATPPSSGETSKGAPDPAQKKQELVKAHEQQQKQLAQMVHQKLLNSLENKGKLFHIDVPHPEVQSFADYIQAVKGGSKGAQAPPPAKPGSIVGGTAAPGANEPGTDGHKKAVQETSTGKTPSTPTGGGGASPSGTPSGGGAPPSAAPAQGGAKNYERVYFFYYGDLVDAALNGKFLQQRMKNEKLRLVLGPVEIQDPVAVSRQLPGKIGEMMSNFRKENPLVSNMADIPISWDLFMKWYQNEFTKPQVREMSVRKFLVSTFNHLVSQALAPPCFAKHGKENELEAPRPTFETIQVGSIKGKDRLGTKKRLTISDISLESNTTGASGNYYGKQGSVYNYVIAHAMRSTMDRAKREGNEDADFNNGVYWFHMGADKGLLKSIKFTKNPDKEYERSQQVAAAQKGGKIVAWQPYNATMQLMGNTLLSMGNIVYINPSALGMGSPQSKNDPAGKIGIGGYYIVKQVSHELSNARWVTTVDAVQTEPTAERMSGNNKTASKPAPAKGGSRYEDNPDPYIGESNIRDRKFSKY